MKAQAGRLGDGQVQTAQRRALAARIGRTQGNRYLQRVAASLQRDGEEESDQTRAKEGASSDRTRARQDSYRAGSALSKLPSRGARVVQRDIVGTFPTATGEFKIDMKAKQGALTGAGPSGLDGKIKFIPGEKAPYSNKIGLVQIVKLTDAGGAHVAPASLPPARGPKLRTTKAKGVEGGFFTDVLHRDFGGTGKDVPEKSQFLPYYQGGVPIFGFKRSNEAADIKAAELEDFPGTTSKAHNLDFSFETVARGHDTGQNYGALKWAFKLRAGKVQNETKSVSDAASATYEAALEKHRAFYTHEPVTFYFGFDRDVMEAGEAGKIDTFLDYLRTFPDVRLTATGYADMRGNAAYNRDLAMRRARAVIRALRARGVDAARINPPVSRGMTTKFTSDAITPQDKDANRRGNRRVTLTFVRIPVP
jgi:outer membrane protein OmpA-like peptidoglycan-associated protein